MFGMAERKIVTPRYMYTYIEEVRDVGSIIMTGHDLVYKDSIVSYRRA